MLKYCFGFFNNLISKIENSEAPIIYFILSFFFITTVRNFLELYSDSEGTFSLKNYLIHFDLYYIALVLSLILLFKFLNNRIDIIKIIRVVLFFFIVIIVLPISDLILSKGKGFNLTYLFTDSHKSEIIFKFFHFFGKGESYGISPGFKIEIFLVLVGSFIYFYLKNKKIIKSLFFTFLTYIILFCFAAFPIVLNLFISSLGFDFRLSVDLMNNSYLILIFILSIVLFFQINKRLFLIILKDIRPYRLLHFIFMFSLGLCLGAKYSNIKFYTISSIDNIILVIISIFFAWLFSVMSNNVTDYDIDKISNPDRPLFKEGVEVEEYKIVAWLFLLLAFFYSFLAGEMSFFIILLFIGNYFLYSMSPFRLKRITFFSKIIISVNSLILVLLGFSHITGSIDNFPRSIIIFFLIAFTAVVNFIDIKDYKGDRACGIKTLPVLLGLKKSKFIIGIFSFLAYFSIYYFIFPEKFLIIPLSFFGCLSFYFINKKNYKEKYIFITYLFSILGLMAYLLF